MSSPADVLNVVEPRHLTRPPAVSSAATEAVELAASAGLVLDAWQVDVLDVALGEREDGKWAAREVALICPRQNGKGSILEAVELAGLFLFDEELILHSAHEFKTAADAFRRIWGLIERTPDLERLVYRKLQNNNDMSIELLTGQRLRFVARTGGSGRGFSADRIILDEAYNLPDKAISAMSFTTAARPNPQVWYTSSAPLADVNSQVLRRLCKRGREGSNGFAYIEYAAAQDADLDDRAAWQEANPGYPFRIDDEAIISERGLNLDDDFARERLGIWFDLEELATHIIDPAAWAICQDPKSGPVEPFCFALDVTPERTAASFAVAGASARGGFHVEITSDAEGHIDHRDGTAWVVARAKELQSRWGGKLAIGRPSPAWSLEQELLDAGVELLPVDTGEHAQACGALFDAVTERRLHHLGQPDLDAAVAGADRRYYGDSWLWARRTSSADISPLVAATLALWGHMQAANTDPALSVY